MAFNAQDFNSFYFAWPWALLLIGLIPIGWALYLRQLRHKLRQTALKFSHTALLSHLHKQPTPWKRLLSPVTTSLLAFCLVLSLARPTMTARVPVNSVDMMLVLDISLSMMAEDIPPNRLEAAKEAAIQFVRSLPRDSRIGLEIFAGGAYILSPPTTKHDEVEAYLRAIRKADLKPRTEIGGALSAALQALQRAEQKPDRANASNNATNPTETEKSSPSFKTKTQKEENSTKPPSRVIILLSDGDSHEGYPWDQAARDALQERVIVNTIGIGSRQGGTITYRGIELPVNFDETTLRRIAEIAKGSYFRVFQQGDFRKVYEQIHERTIHYEQREVDLGFILAGFGFMFLLVGFVGLLMI